MYMCFRGSKTFQRSRGHSINSNKVLNINPLVIKISVVVIYKKKSCIFFLPFDSTSMKLLLFRDILHDVPVAGI